MGDVVGGISVQAFSGLLDKLTAKLHGWFEAFVISLPNLLVAILLVLIFSVASGWVERTTSRVLARVTKNEPISALLGTTARVATLIAGVFIALGLLNLDKTVTSLLAGVGVVGLALGFAFQDIASNFMSGFIMALRRPFATGDLVKVNGELGRVQRLTLRSTELETLDGLSIILPNKDVFQNTIVNYTRTRFRRLDIAVGTAYGDDMTGVRHVVAQAARSVPDRDESRDVEVFFEGFGAYSIDFVVRVWLNDAEEITYLNARSEGMITIKRALDQAGFTIPFPIRTLDFGAKVVGGTNLDAMPLQVGNFRQTTDDSTS